MGKGTKLYRFVCKIGSVPPYQVAS